jgi:transposase-like protein
VEVIACGVRRLSWTADKKSRIVVESLGPELTPTEVARKHEIGTGQLYAWRQQHPNVLTALVRRDIAAYQKHRVRRLRRQPA